MEYPATAQTVKFKPIGDHTRTYRIWKLGSRWAWYAMGQSGISDSMEQAMRDAREYILMGFSGLPRAVKSNEENTNGYSSKR